MHDDARRGEAEFLDGDFGDARRLQQAEYTGGVFVAGSGTRRGEFLKIGLFIGAAAEDMGNILGLSLVARYDPGSGKPLIFGTRRQAARQSSAAALGLRV